VTDARQRPTSCRASSSANRLILTRLHVTPHRHQAAVHVALRRRLGLVSDQCFHSDRWVTLSEGAIKSGKCQLPSLSERGQVVIDPQLVAVVVAC
jgi:hypothetical protein